MQGSVLRRAIKAYYCHYKIEQLIPVQNALQFGNVRPLQPRYICLRTEVCWGVLHRLLPQETRCTKSCQEYLGILARSHHVWELSVGFFSPPPPPSRGASASAPGEMQ